jgi:hypothetical protein
VHHAQHCSGALHTATARQSASTTRVIVFGLLAALWVLVVQIHVRAGLVSTVQAAFIQQDATILRALLPAVTLNLTGSLFPCCTLLPLVSLPQQPAAHKSMCYSSLARFSASWRRSPARGRS